MNHKRHITACMIGNIIEWYEFTLFAYLAPVIAGLFFPEENRLAALLSTFLVFAAGFIIRPFGAIVLGHIGDLVGRAKILKFSILLLSLSSVATGFLPTYQHIGLFAPLLLIICRLVQGLCIGGELVGAVIYLTESAPPKRRAWLSSTTNNGGNFGVLLAISACAVLSHYLSPALFASIGWRTLFIFGGLMGLVGLWLRQDMAESTIFSLLQKKLKEKYFPIHYVFKHQRKLMLQLFFLLFMSACGSYVLLGYLSTYLHVFLNIPLDQAYQLQTIFIVISLFLVPIFALVSDKIGRRALLLFASIGYLIFAIPLFHFLQHTVHWWLFLPLIIFYSAEQSTIPAAIVEMFPGKGRYTGISIAYNFTMALVGGTSAYINTWLINHFHNNMMIAYYIMACMFVSFIIILFFLPRRFGHQQSLKCLGSADI